MEPRYEKCQERIAIGDGNDPTVVFHFQLRAPVKPGSVCVRVLDECIVDQLAQLENPNHVKQAACDVVEDGLLHGHFTGCVNYLTGLLAFTLACAPAGGEPIIVYWKREIHRLNEAKVEVLLPDGRKEWVRLKELYDALSRA